VGLAYGTVLGWQVIELSTAKIVDGLFVGACR
jgi:hypothetical protein